MIGRTLHYDRGELEGVQARLEWDQMPRKALHSKACGEQSEDFCPTCGAKVVAFLRLSKKSKRDFFDSLSIFDQSWPGTWGRVAKLASSSASVGM